MKKILFLLLCTVSIYGQTSTGQEQSFPYGIVNESLQTITTPTFIGTFGTDGTQGKIPSALIEKTDNKQNSLAVDGTGTKYPTVDAVNAALPKSYSKIVYVNSTNPNTATIFDTANPPITNNNGLKVDTNNLYIGTDASTWVYDGIVFNYVTKSLPAISNFYLGGSTADAGSDKVQPIKRNGTIESTGFIKTGGTSSQALLANGSVLTNPISGNGTTNTIAKWTGTTTQGNSNITDNGTTVDINLPTSIKGTAASDGGQLGSELTTTATGTNWTGTGFGTGYTHTIGDVTPLVSTLAAVTNNLYQITYTITGRTTGSVTINYGGIAISGITSSGNSGPKATSTSTLNIVPTTDFNGTVVLSIKVISQSVATTSFKNSSGAVTNEIRAHSSSSNFSIGLAAGRSITMGVYNSAIGQNALANNTTGNNNSAIGQNALANNTIGNNNSAIGYFSLLNNTTGSNNSAFGQNALLNNTTGNNNSAIGQNALANNTTGGSNSAIGYAALLNNTTGSSNSAVGESAGRYIANKSTPATILNNSIMLGYRTSPLADNQTNQVVIGYDATGLGSNTTVIGNSSTTTARVYGRQLVNTSTDNGTDQLQVNGTTKTNALTLATTPTTSAGTYDILTRNTSTGIVEKVAALGFTPENVANKSDSYTASSSTTYASTKALVDGLATKQNTLTNPITGTGTNGHISFWNGANTQTGNSGLIWDNTNKRLGIGTTNPLQKFVVSDTGANGIEIAIDTVPSLGCIIQSYDRASFVYRPLEYSSSKHFFNNGNVLIATGTDNGVDKLQVNGTISATAGTTANQVVIKSQLDAAVPYKKYVALISQTGTSEPTATVLENTLGGTIVWTRVNPGLYSGILTGAFTADKTILLNNNPVGGVFTNIFSSVNTITIQTRKYSNVQTDDGLSNTSIEIRVYN